MNHSWKAAVLRGLLCLLCALLLDCMPGREAFALEPKDTPAAKVPGADPYVLLDAAKMTLAEGRLQDAAVQLAAIPLGVAEPYVDEEIIVQRMLISGAFLTANSYVASQVAAAGEGNGAYCRWLREEAQKYGAEFAALSQQYLGMTEKGYWCTFIRFRLPNVTEDHLQDVQLFTDPQILGPASKNWEEGRDSLGKGVALSQARVALVLAAAAHYDLREASSTILGVARRLSAGVPLRPSTLLDWMAQTAAQHAVPGTPLAQIEPVMEARLLAFSGIPGAVDYSQRAKQRQQIMAGNAKALAAPLQAPVKQPPAPAPLETPLEKPALPQEEAMPALPPTPGQEAGPAGPPAAQDSEDGAPDESVKPEDDASTDDAAGAESAEGDAAGTAEEDGQSGAEAEAKEKKEKERKRPHARPIPRRPRVVSVPPGDSAGEDSSNNEAKDAS